MSTLWQDIRYGIRMLEKSPGFTLVAVLTLALGIGANTAIFTMINTLILRPLQGVKDAKQLMLVTDSGNASLCYPLYEQLRDRSQSFSGLFAATSISKQSMTVTNINGTEAESVLVQAVSANFFSVLGVPAVAGRIFTPDDDCAGNAQAVAVISYGYWQRRFGLDPSVIGKMIVLEEIPFIIVGVTRPGFFGFEADGGPDLWWPIKMYPQVDPEKEPLSDTSASWLRVIGRLKAHVPQDWSCRELDMIFKQFLKEQAPKWGVSEKEWQNDYARRRIKLQAIGAGYTTLRDQLQKPLYIIMTIVGLVLLVACANLAGLLLARGEAKRYEFSMRAALGASRLTLVRQLVTESLLLAAAGGFLGLILAQWGVQLLAGYIIPGYGQKILLDLTPDMRILGFTLMVSAITGVLFDLIPAWRGTRFDLTTNLKKQAGNITGRDAGQRWNKVMVISQIALSCCLLIGTGLFVRTVQKLKTLDVGLNRKNLMVFSLDLGDNYDDARRASLYQEVLRHLENLPGVRFASFSTIRSMSGSEIGWGLPKVAVEDPGSTAKEFIKLCGTGVGLRYFETMGIPLLRGRIFDPQDLPAPGVEQTSESTRPIIIDQTSARKLFGDDNPVGKLLISEDSTSWPTFEVIGVVGDVIHKKLRWGKRLSMYGLESHWKEQFFYVRTFGSPLDVAGGIRQIVRELDPTVEITGMNTMNELVNAQLIQERTLSQLTSFFSLSALLLACIGLYGILSYSVVRRMREIGLRMALGAQRYNVLSMVVLQGMKMTLLGCCLGIILTAGLARIVSSMLYGITATDPLTFIFTGLLLCMVAFVSCWLPARRASKIDPMIALRYE